MYRTIESVAADLIANIPANDIGEQVIRLAPGHIETIDCGFNIALPVGWEAQIHCRCDMAQKGVQVTSGIGDGRLTVILNNAGREIVNITHGDRFAQISLKPVWYFSWNVVKELE